MYKRNVVEKEGNSTSATMWMDIEDIILNEISPSQKDKYRMVLFIPGT